MNTRYWPEEQNEFFKKLVGKKIIDVRGLCRGSKYVSILFEDGSAIRFYHSQSCCESVDLDDVCGDVDDLLNAKLYGIELRNIGFSRYIGCLSFRASIDIAGVGGVGPGRIQMQTEHGAMGFLHAREEFLKIGQTLCGATGIIVCSRPGRAPPPTIEKHVWRVHHTMQHHVIAMTVDQPFSFHMQRRQWLHALRKKCNGRKQHRCTTHQKSFHSHCFVLLCFYWLQIYKIFIKTSRCNRIKTFAQCCKRKDMISSLPQGVTISFLFFF